MSNSLRPRLYSATAQTFENLGFLLPASDLNDEQRSARIAALVEVGFSGKFDGRVVLGVSAGVLPAMAGNMLGEDGDSLSREMQLDALGELANVICGNVLPEIAGLAETFALAPPRAIPEWGPAPPSCRVEVGLDEGRAEVRLFLERTAAGEPGREAA